MLMITNKKSHKPFQMTRKSSTFDDFAGSVRTLLCQLRAYVVGGRHC